MSGDLVAYIGPRCDQRSVTDFGRPGSPTIALPGDAHLLRVAGRFAALARGERNGGFVAQPIEVYDSQTGELVYRLGSDRVPGYVAGLDVDSDGTVVIIYRSLRAPFGQGVAWASVGEPWVHGLLPALGVRAARVVGGQVVVSSRPSVDVDTGTLSLVGLDGSARVLASGVSLVGGESFDFDGREVTWVLSRCDRAEILRAPLEGLPLAPERARRRCPLVLTAPVWRASPTALRLRVSCAGLESTCTLAAVSVRTLGRRGSRPVVLVRRDFDRVGYGSSFAVPLTRAGRRLLARHRRLAVRVSGYISNGPDPLARRPPLGAQLRSTTTVIVSRR